MSISHSSFHSSVPLSTILFLSYHPSFSTFPFHYFSLSISSSLLCFLHYLFICFCCWFLHLYFFHFPFVVFPNFFTSLNFFHIPPFIPLLVLPSFFFYNLRTFILRERGNYRQVTDVFQYLPGCVLNPIQTNFSLSVALY